MKQVPILFLFIFCNTLKALVGKFKYNLASVTSVQWLRDCQWKLMAGAGKGSNPWLGMTGLPPLP